MYLWPSEFWIIIKILFSPYLFLIFFQRGTTKSIFLQVLLLSFSFNETSKWARHCICVSNYVSVIVIKSMKYYSLNWCEIVGLLKCLDTSLTTPLLTRCISFMNTFMQQYFFIVNSTKPIKIIWYVQRKYAFMINWIWNNWNRKDHSKLIFSPNKWRIV